MTKDPATYIPFIDPKRTIQRELRDNARYNARLALGINEDSERNLNGLDDMQFCYLLKTNRFMPDDLYAYSKLT